MNAAHCNVQEGSNAMYVAVVVRGAYVESGFVLEGKGVNS